MTTTGISSGVPPASVVTGMAPRTTVPGAAVAVPTVTVLAADIGQIPWNS